jgi:hypothetical protein
LALIGKNEQLRDNKQKFRAKLSKSFVFRSPMRNFALIDNTGLSFIGAKNRAFGIA